MKKIIRNILAMLAGLSPANIASKMLQTVEKLSGADSKVELAVVLGLTALISVLPGPALIFPFLYGKIKRFFKTSKNKD